MKYEQSIYPYTPDITGLPFYLTGLGASRFQRKVVRENGYQWHQILYCVNGDGVLIYDDKAVNITAGDFFLLPKGYPHIYYNKAEIWDIRWIAFDGLACEQIFQKFKITKPCVIRGGKEEIANMERILDEMYKSQTEDVLYCESTCSLLVYEYLLSFGRILNKEFDAVKSKRLSMILPALNYIHNNYTTDFPLTVLNEIIGITPQHFCRIFKATMNMRPIEYLTNMRIDEAKRLIAEERVAICDAAHRSGFTDASYFSTVFKKYVGVSPDSFKKSLL